LGLVSLDLLVLLIHENGHISENAGSVSLLVVDVLVVVLKLLVDHLLQLVLAEKHGAILHNCLQ
tara:strand:- start:466 stop:657 length:192 start_codon:yes stop_codon:yes gene_type:complete